MRWLEIINENYMDKVTEFFDDQQLYNNSVVQGDTVEDAIEQEKLNQQEEEGFNPTQLRMTQ